MSWRNRRVDVLMLTAIGLWLATYLPMVSNDAVVGRAAAVVGAVFLGLILTGAC